MDARPYTLEELRGPPLLDISRVRATALALRQAQEVMEHMRAFGHGAVPADMALDALQRQREAVSQAVAAYPVSESLGQVLCKVGRAVPLVPLVRAGK